MNAKDVDILIELILRLLKFLTVAFLLSYSTDWDVLSETLCGVATVWHFWKPRVV